MPDPLYDRQMTQILSTLAFVLAVGAIVAAQARKEDVEGIRNFTRVDATVACAGATELAAIPEVARRGYKAIVNLRQASENGANIDESKAAAEVAGLTFIHLPLNGREPDVKVADQFIAAVTDEANQPVFINCASANRVGALWLTKRMLVDNWDEARALEEAKTIGLSSEALQKFALDYVASKR
jgi:uncharacterized protein (TIGR01244 family)